MDSSRKPEPAACADIDALLSAAGWIVQDYQAFHLGDFRGIASCAVPPKSGRCRLQYLIRLRPRAPLLDSRFLRDQMASHRLRSQMEFSAKSTSGVNNINSKEIQRLVIALPPLPEQREIVRLLDEQFEVIAQNGREIDRALRQSAALRRSILKKAFTGKLVPQDPSDEPAAELLARLRAELAVIGSLRNRLRSGRGK